MNVVEAMVGKGADINLSQGRANRPLDQAIYAGQAETTLKLVGMLLSDGLVMSSLSYEVSPETLRNAQDDLTAEALAAVGRRAASIAEATHLAVLRYRDLRVGNAETEGRPVPRFSGAAMAAGAPPVAEPGEAVVRVTIEAELLLGQPRT